MKEFFEKVDFEKNQQTTKKHKEIDQHAELNIQAPLFLEILYNPKRSFSSCINKQDTLTSVCRTGSAQETFEHN